MIISDLNRVNKNSIWIRVFKYIFPLILCEVIVKKYVLKVYSTYFCTVQLYELSWCACCRQFHSHHHLILSQYPARWLEKSFNICDSWCYTSCNAQVVLNDKHPNVRSPSLKYLFCDPALVCILKNSHKVLDWNTKEVVSATLGFTEERRLVSLFKRVLPW